MKKTKKNILVGMLVALGCLSVAGTALAEKSPGKYCETAGRCIDPIATNGVVTTPHYLASEAGLAVLRQGGNAVDAAIAAASTLAVVYPQMNTIGGDNFWLIYNAKTGEVRALNASGRSGEKASIEYYKSKGLDKIPARGYLAANTVPGVVSGWDAAHKYARSSMGNTGMPWNRLFDSAISYAQKGFPVTPSLQRWAEINVDPKDSEFRNLQRFDGFRQTYLKPDGAPYKVGEIMKLPELATSLGLIAKSGADVFYRGVIAKKIVADLQANGGMLTEKDFASHKADWVKPLTVDYRGYKAYNLPPNTQGMASLEILNILNNFDVKKLGEGSADYYHLVVEATKEAFVDRDKYLSDPDFVQIPLERLLSKQHGQQQAKRIRMDQTAQNLKLLEPKGDTIWLGVVDKDGNAVSLIQSIYHDFGSAIVPKGTGILLQNRGSFFSLDPAHVNRLEPKKRTFHTLNAAMLLKDNKPYLVYGTMGGEGQPQTQAAIVTRVVDFGMYPQDAITAPRWLNGRTWGAASNDLKMEGRIPEEVLSELKRRGHPVVKVDDYTDTMGHAGAIMVDPKTGLKYGATDPRGDGLAAGY
ncbi:gamma-glutamyltransferase [Oxalobacter vibrioformis]|uniref:Glutathione hydrolase proenzyme n=1 Tax=Oxalobacter vibrioformis TaxID=933080 RepID=A0A9E9P438_9BURK|nr:gamma-glutamyltransferase [Oxalobacter vibrioformis]WAW10890.1 gamma-glutamyltransferase [Oxalobacter vibrioformis]